jgi:pyruvate ferredoxin oxidoreductase beta subunit
MSETQEMQSNSEQQTVKFYQTGTFTVGNRLLDKKFRTVQATQERSNSIDSGHRACQGCGQALGARYALDAAMRVTDNKIIAANATGCLEVFTTPYPETAWSIPWIHSLFGNVASVAAGIAASLKAKGDSETRVIAQGGDGGTTDIGFACLSGMFDRNDDVLYICYDNGAYMNTGVQRSSATPGGARTSTTMPVGDHPGSSFKTGKFLPGIAMAHEIPYVATASVHDLHDLERKVEKAMTFRGARYLQINVPCPLGWGSETSQTIKLARNGVESGLVPLFEAEYGELTNSTKIRSRIPVEDYLKLQRRFAHILKPGNADELEEVRAIAEKNIKRYNLLAPHSLHL